MKYYRGIFIVLPLDLIMMRMIFIKAKWIFVIALDTTYSNKNFRKGGSLGDDLQIGTLYNKNSIYIL
jgi:hypothetical protein